MRTFQGDIGKIEEITRPIAESWLNENLVKYSELILGKPWCGSEGWYVDDKNLSLEEFIFKFKSPFWNKEIDLIVPFFNEEGAVDKVHYLNKKAERLFNIKKYIYVENGSKDGTRMKLQELAKADEKINLVFLDNNVGYGGGVKAGLSQSNSPIIILNHADLQFDLYNFVYTNLDSIKNQQKINILSKRHNRSHTENINSSILRYILSCIFFSVIKDFNGQPKVFERSLLGSLEDLPDNFCIDLAIYTKICADSIQLPIIQNVRKIGKSSWSGSMRKRVQIFLGYLSWAIRNR